LEAIKKAGGGLPKKERVEENLFCVKKKKKKNCFHVCFFLSLGAARGRIWWMERELTEKKKYMPKK